MPPRSRLQQARDRLRGLTATARETRPAVTGSLAGGADPSVDVGDDAATTTPQYSRGFYVTVERIESLRVVDKEFYETLTGETFESVRDAIIHYLTAPKKAELALSPLIEPQWVLRTRFAGDMNWYEALYSAPDLFSLSPVFDPTVYATSLGDEAEGLTTTLALVNHFLDHADESTPLPVVERVPGEAPTWGDVRTAALRGAVRDRAFAETRVQRFRTEWDTLHEDEFRARVAGEIASLEADPAPFVSVVLPTKDRRKKLAKAIHSLREQSYPNWEVLVVDDGSTDSTAEFLAKVSSEDSRIRIVAPHGHGVSAARNAGLAAAAGDHVAFLDSDNTWRTDFLLLSLAGLRSTGARSSHSGLMMVNTTPTGDALTYRGEVGSMDYLLAGNFIDMNALVLERSLLDEVGHFDEALERWVDYDLVLRLATVAIPEYLPFLGVNYDNRVADDRISIAKPLGWQDVVLSRHIIDWQALSVALPDRIATRVSVVIPTYTDWFMTARAIEALLANSTGHDVEVVVVDNGSSRIVLSILEKLFATSPGVRLVRAPRNLNFALGSNYGFANSTGGVVVMLNNDTEVTPGWLDDLLEPLDDPEVAGVQPLLLYPDGTVQAAGTVFGGEHVMPWHFLAGHPVEDVLRAGVDSFTAVTAAALVMRASDFLALEGFDPVFTNGLEDVDLCLRAIEHRGGAFRVVHSSTVIHYESKTPGRMKSSVPNRVLFDDRWSGRYPAPQLDLYERAGFLAHYRAVDPLPSGEIRTGGAVVARPSRTVAEGVSAGLPCLRWSLKIAAHPGERGRLWGDTIFAHDLQHALALLGQEVVVDARESFYRQMSYLDDVVVVIRGLERVDPQPGAFNVLWVISHPELVTDEEMARFDAVYAASATWAAAATERTGRPVLPLLQATNPSKFFVDEGSAAGVGVSFVGSTRAEYRPVVRSAVDAGVEVAIYGPGWEEFVPAELIKADRLAADSVGATYRSSGIVLADHWPDMAANGFISNRLFDAVASGAVVVSDHVDGIAEVFGAAVRAVHDPADVGGVLTDLSWLPSRAEVVERALAIGREHSFEARAATLLQAALEHRSKRG